MTIPDDLEPMRNDDPDEPETETETETEPASYSPASVPSVTAHARQGADLTEKHIAALMSLVQTVNERYETRENVLADLANMFRQTLAETQTTMKLWQKMIGQLDQLEDGLAQSAAALIQMHQRLTRLLSDSGDKPPRNP